jgi:hypothetical protein
VTRGCDRSAPPQGIESIGAADATVMTSFTAIIMSRATPIERTIATPRPPNIGGRVDACQLLASGSPTPGKPRTRSAAGYQPGGSAKRLIRISACAGLTTVVSKFSAAGASLGLSQYCHAKIGHGNPSAGVVGASLHGCGIGEV